MGEKMKQQEQQEFEQQLAEALDKVEQGYITTEYMSIIRTACNAPNRKNDLVFNFDEII
jgi:hypothetical protein